jgi:hypothetical protein
MSHCTWPDLPFFLLSLSLSLSFLFPSAAKFLLEMNKEKAK